MIDTILTFSKNDASSPMTRALVEFRPQLGAAIHHVMNRRAADASALLVVCSPVVYAALRPRSTAARTILGHPAPDSIPGHALIACDCTLLRTCLSRASDDIARWIDELTAYVAAIQPAITLGYMAPDGWGYARIDATYCARGGAA